jgi:hypothetical protein
MSRQLFFSLALLALLSACGGSSAASPSPTPSRTSSSPAPLPTPSFKTYTDAKFQFSFDYPNDWTVHKGATETDPQTGTTEYVVHVDAPKQLARAEIDIDGNHTPLPPFKQGKVTRDPAAPNTYWHYFHQTVSGIRAMRVEQWTGKKVFEVDTFIVTKHLRYDVRILAGSKPLSPTTGQPYNGIVDSLVIHRG